MQFVKAIPLQEATAKLGGGPVIGAELKPAGKDFQDQFAASNRGFDAGLVVQLAGVFRDHVENAEEEMKWRKVS